MKRRWIYPAHGEPFEVGADYVPTPRVVLDSVLWNDRAYQDAADPRFHSRTQHREYMKQHGLTTVDDFGGEFKQREKQRHEAAAAQKGAVTKQDVVEAIRKLTNGR